MTHNAPHSSELAQEPHEVAAQAFDLAYNELKRTGALQRMELERAIRLDLDARTPATTMGFWG